MSIITIVGAGVMGSATSFPLTDNGHEVRLVGTHLDADIIDSCKETRFHPSLKRAIPAGVQPYHVEEIGKALDGAEVIVSGVNSLGVRWFAGAIGPHLKPGQLVIAVTKGLESADNGDLVILPDVVAGDLPRGIREKVTLAAIGGPCIAGELAARRQTCVFFGSRDGDAAKHLASLFRTPYYHVWTTTDLVGLEVGVALKNAYALGVGVASGILEKQGGPDTTGAHMHNLASALFAQGCVEIDRALQLVGASRAFAYGPPGAGDLYVTCQGGRSSRQGHLLGFGHRFPEVREIMTGYTLESAEIIRSMGSAIPRLQARGLISARDFPLMRALADAVVNERPLDLPLDDFYGGLAS